MSYYFLVGFLPISRFIARLSFCFCGLFLLFLSNLSPSLWKFLLCLHPQPLKWPKLLLKPACASSTVVDPMSPSLWFFNSNSFFCSAVRSIEINSKYLVNFLYRYCCCNMILEAWNVENVFSSILDSMISTPHNSNQVTMSKSADL